MMILAYVAELAGHMDGNFFFLTSSPVHPLAKETTAYWMAIYSSQPVMFVLINLTQDNTLILKVLFKAHNAHALPGVEL